MVYRVVPENSIRKYINSKLAEYDSKLASLPSHPLSSEYTEADRAKDIRYTEKLKQSDLDSLALLDTALREGKASAVVFNDDGFESFVSFVVREDGLIRCFETNGSRDIRETGTGSYELDRIYAAHGGMKIAEKHRKEAKDANDLYGEHYYNFLYQHKLAQFLAIYGASRVGTGSADAVIDGDVVEHFEAERQGDKIVYTVTYLYQNMLNP